MLLIKLISIFELEELVQRYRRNQAILLLNH